VGEAERLRLCQRRRVLAPRRARIARRGERLGQPCPVWISHPRAPARRSAASEASYDLVTVFEAIHDMAHPVEALAAMRRLAAPDGAVLVMDERTNDRMTIGDPIEQFLYGASVLVCLPTGMGEENSAATGTVMRPDTFGGYAHAAGFEDVEVLPIEHLFFRFYRLR
jgi:ubiquinone/menaquinone biosynthesis C-methylase UbiE